MDGPVPAPLPLPSGANGRPGFTSPMSKEKSAEHTPLMKHDGCSGIICKQTPVQQCPLRSESHKRL